jgi:hypothetical protein
VPPGRLLARATIVAGVAGVGLALAGSGSAARSPLVLLFLAAAPAMAVGGLLRGLDLFGRVFAAIIGTVVINVGVAETMLAAHLWSPRAGLVVVALIASVLGLVQVPKARSTLLRAVAGRLGHP